MSAIGPSGPTELHCKCPLPGPRIFGNFRFLKPAWGKRRGKQLKLLGLNPHHEASRASVAASLAVELLLDRPQIGTHRPSFLLTELDGRHVGMDRGDSTF
jgi:hypothetical protein